MVHSRLYKEDHYTVEPIKAHRYKYIDVYVHSFLVFNSAQKKKARKGVSSRFTIMV